MVLIGLNGSPRAKGNCSFLLDVALRSAQEEGIEVKRFEVHQLMLTQEKPYCDACSSPCNRSCFENTPLEEAFEEMKKASGLILASPVYFGTVSAQLKAFWDKTRFLRAEKALIGKVGGAIAVGATRFGGQETTLRTLHDMMLIQGMTVVAEGTVETDAGHQGVCSTAPSREDEFAQKRAVILGKRLAEEIKIRG